MRWPWQPKAHQASAYTRINVELWNEYAPREAASVRDRVADFCVKEHRRPRLDTLRFYVHMPQPFTFDPYNDLGSVGWKIDLA